MEIYGQLVREFRKRAGLTQGELAERISVRQATVSRWERGDREVPLELVETIAEACGTTERVFINRAEELRVAVNNRNTSQPSPTGHVTSEAGLKAWHDRIMAAGIDDPRLLLLLLVLEHYIDRDLWVISSTIPELAAQAALPVDMVENLWAEVLASPFVARVGSGEWTLRLVVPPSDED